jgi:ribosomal protein S19
VKSTTSKCLLKKKSSFILPEFIGKTVGVYNGNRFIDLTITASMVGYRFGSFIATRKLHVFRKQG